MAIKPVSLLAEIPQTPAGLTDDEGRQFHEICAALIDGPGLFRLDLGPVRRLAELRAAAADLHALRPYADGSEIGELLRTWLALCREIRLQEAALGISLSAVQRRAALEESKAREAEYLAAGEARVMAEIEELLDDNDDYTD